ncbi:ABC transporter permease [Robinsoniella peoriensis]|uniref:ABC transporter permease n=1 Tax=Robinsoniella peoriensis TaxID=180332 RepID=UPI0005C7D1B0|nr:ABC transporter permease [Robinsoniella peoriensis]
METVMTYGSKRRINQRKMTLIIFVAAVTFLVAVAVGGIFCGEAAQETDFSRKNMMPGFQYLFGTDWLGRDMFVRTIKGLSMSILIGVCAASVSAFVALVLGIAAATLGRKVDAVITWFIDLIMGIPHMLLLILICVALGKGLTGVIVGVALTHWTSLARVIRAEVMQLKESQYIKIAEKLGHSKFKIAVKHMLPHLVPQFLVGLILLFPHAILHESSITFLGFGLSNEQPAIGIILSESMKYLVTGKWWLALFPGVMLVLTVVLFDVAGESLRKIIDPASAQE